MWTCLKRSNEGDWSGDEDGPEDLKNSEDPTFTMTASLGAPCVRPWASRWNLRRHAYPMMRPTGQHIIYNAQPFRAFDMDAFR